MARCPNCKHKFRTLEDEEGMHACPHCGYGPPEDNKEKRDDDVKSGDKHSFWRNAGR